MMSSTVSLKNIYLAYYTKNPEAVHINSRYGYISIDENLTKIEAVVIYGMCTRDRPEVVWDFPVVI